MTEQPSGRAPGFDLELLPGWEEEWVELERERVRQLELHLLDDVVSPSVQEGRHGDGVDAALRAIRLDPWRESSHAGLLRALLAGGNRAAAIAHFRRFAARCSRARPLAVPGPHDPRRGDPPRPTGRAAHNARPGEP